MKVDRLSRTFKKSYGRHTDLVRQYRMDTQKSVVFPRKYGNYFSGGISCCCRSLVDHRDSKKLEYPQVGLPLIGLPWVVASQVLGQW